ncbi:MAG: nucleoside hydrolase [Clostridia bacterium]|nr:nucleoside hydrolase [Clostridia bacterium]
MSEKAKVLSDLKIDGNCTKFGALSVLHVLADLGEADILAVTACFKSPLAAGCIKALNRYYGRPDLPVGILHRQDETHPTPFMEPVNKTFCTDHPDGEDVADTVEIMRKTLAAQEDGSVRLVVVGCFASVAALLESGPDVYSPLTGQELAERKISGIYNMGGSFDTCGDTPFAENNIVVQIPSAKYVTEHWKGLLVHSGYEIGIRTRSLKEFRFHGSKEHPLRMMYEINDGEGFAEGNPSWDQTAVLEAVRPGMYFDRHAYGRMEITDDGLTVWHEDDTSRHTYLLPKVPFDEVAAVINDMSFPEWRDFL